MEKILISACLAGDLVRYDGKRKPFDHVMIREWEDRGMLVRFCPEVAGGLATPRPPAEIINGNGGDVLGKKARILTSTGKDVSSQFIRGALLALELIRVHKIKIAILKEKSPSCGTGYIYDGTFKKKLVPGMGVTATLLKKNGVIVFPETEIEAVKSFANINFKHNF